MNKPIIIIGAMDCEYQYMVKQLKNVKQITSGNFRFFEGEYNNKNVVIIASLIGMVNAACATTLAIKEYDPKLIIIQGTSGAHNPSLKQGDIIIGEKIIELGSYYTKPRKENEGIDYKNWDRLGEQMLINNEVKYVHDMYSNKELVDKALMINNKYGRVLKGTIGSADQWNREVDVINYYHKELGSDLEEMEGFAVAQAASMFNVPFIDIRIISNSEFIPDKPFNEKFGIYCQEFILDLINKY